MIHEIRFNAFSVSANDYASGQRHFEYDGSYTYRLYVFDYASALEDSGNVDLFALSYRQFSNLVPIRTITGSVVVYEHK